MKAKNGRQARHTHTDSNPPFVWTRTPQKSLDMTWLRLYALPSVLGLLYRVLALFCYCFFGSGSLPSLPSNLRVCTVYTRHSSFMTNRRHLCSVQRWSFFCFGPFWPLCVLHATAVCSVMSNVCVCGGDVCRAADSLSSTRSLHAVWGGHHFGRHAPCDSRCTVHLPPHHTTPQAFTTAFSHIVSPAPTWCSNAITCLDHMHQLNLRRCSRR